jgi:hypothetical protein
MQTFKATWKHKKCDICDHAEVQNVSKRSYLWPTRFGQFEFILQDSYCKKCFYPFVSEIPSEEFLEKFYQTSFYNNENFEPDFDVKARIDYIKSFCSPDIQLLEVGSGNGLFLKKLKDNSFSHCDGIDILITDENDGPQVAQNKKTYDLILSYFVLEHILNPNQWLQSLKKYSNKDALYIFEIPDFENCPQHTLNHEHFLFPTRLHLKMMLERNGFDLIDLSSVKSREFGMSFAFCHEDSQKYKRHEFSFPQGEEYVRSIFKKYDLERKLHDDRINQIVDQALKSGKKDLVVWGANELALDIYVALQEKDIAVKILDSNEQKIGRSFFNTAAVVENSTSPLTEDSYIIISAVAAYTQIKDILLGRKISATNISDKL